MHLRADANTSVIAGLIVVTAALLLCFDHGIFDRRLRILADHNHVGFSSDANSVSRAYGYQEDNSALLDCLLTAGRADNAFCQLSIRLSDSLANGIDLTPYDSVRIKLEYQGPKAFQTLRMYLRHYDSEYSHEDDPASLKYNTALLTPSAGMYTAHVPLGAFQVENWWIAQMSLNSNQSKTDLSNVSLIEFATPQQAPSGNYKLSVHRVEFKGKWISEFALYRLLLVLWAGAAIFLLNRQRMVYERLSSEDRATGLANRRGLNLWIEARMRERRYENLCLFYIDIDDFKTINDEYGHQMGDQLLTWFSRGMKLTVARFVNSLAAKPLYLCCRISGDEFGVAMVDIDDEHLSVLAKQLLESVREPYISREQSLHIHISIGIASTRARSIDNDSLIWRADAAMYESKRLGKNQYQIYNDKLSSDVEFRRSVAVHLREAVEKEAFSLVFMPIHDVNSRQLVAAEVLLRCQLDTLRGVGPDIFIPIAEQFGIIEEIDFWVLENTFALLEPYVSRALRKSLMFCINISSRELHHRYFVEKIRALLEQYHVPPSLLELEITETNLIYADERSIQTLTGLRDLGVGLSLDDYGTGFTSFNQLTNFPITTIKIDRSFVSGDGEHHLCNRTMVDVILSIARSYGLTTIAEGVESELQLGYLRDKGCHLAQGYLMNKPMGWEPFLEASGLAFETEVLSYETRSW